MTENERIVTDLCHAFGRMDANELIDYFAADSGYFELEQGKIKAWREYFDLGTMQQGPR